MKPNPSRLALAALFALVTSPLVAQTVRVGSIAAGDTNIGNVDVASIAAGTNNIGDVDVASIAAGNNNIGDVDVASSALPTGAATAAKQPALGTAGSASTDVLTVQGIASGTALPVSGTVACSNCSGTGVSVNEDVASASADPGTPAYAVRQDTISNLTSTDGDYAPLKVNSVGRLYAESTVTSIAAGDNNIGNVDVLSIAAGTNNIGDVDIASIAAGDNNIGNVDIVSSALPTGAATAANQTTEIGHLDGLEALLAEIEAAVEIIDGLPVGIGSTTAGQVGVLGQCAVTTAAPSGYTTAQTHPCSMSTAGSIRVEVTNGTAGGTSAVDEATFTDSVSTGTPGMFVAESSSPGTVGEGKLGIAAMTLNKAQKVSLYSAAGAELVVSQDATGGSAIRTTGPQDMGEAKDFDGSALPNAIAAIAEGDAVPFATSLVGVQYVMVVSEDGALERGTATTPLIAGVSLLGGVALPIEDAAETSGGVGIYAMGVLRTTPAASTSTTGENTMASYSSVGGLWSTPVAAPNGGGTGKRHTSVGTTEDEHAVATAAATLYGVIVTNTNAAARYLRCEDDTAANTAPGSETPEIDLAIPSGGAAFEFGATGMAFANAITCWLVTGAADTDVAEVAANEIKVQYVFKQ